MDYFIFILLFYFDRVRSGGFRLFILVWVTSVLIVPSVFDLIWGVWDFPVENREKLSVSTLNKLGFVNDVEGCFGFLEAGALHVITIRCWLATRRVPLSSGFFPYFHTVFPTRTPTLDWSPVLVVSFPATVERFLQRCPKKARFFWECISFDRFWTLVLGV